jgi:hypothetical protein
MRLDEQPVGARRQRRLGERRHKFALPAALAAAGTRQLHRVRRVEDCRIPVLAMIANERMSTTRFW